MEETRRGEFTLGMALKEMREGKFDFTRRGECVGCGTCCSNLLPLKAQEITRIRRYVGQHHIKPRPREVVRAGSHGEDLRCPFRDDAAKKCKIYEVRPEICRQFKCDKERTGERSHFPGLLSSYQVVKMRETFFPSSAAGAVRK